MDSETDMMKDFIKLISKTRRRDMLKLLGEYSPILHKLGGDKVILCIIDAIKMTAKMWP